MTRNGALYMHNDKSLKQKENDVNEKYVLKVNPIKNLYVMNCYVICKTKLMYYYVIY